MCVTATRAALTLLCPFQAFQERLEAQKFDFTDFVNQFKQASIARAPTPLPPLPPPAPPPQRSCARKQPCMWLGPGR